MCGGFESFKINVVASVFSESLRQIADRITERNLVQVHFCFFKMERESLKTFRKQHADLFWIFMLFFSFLKPSHFLKIFLNFFQSIQFSLHENSFFCTHFYQFAYFENLITELQQYWHK